MTVAPAPFPGFSTPDMDRIWSADGAVAAMLQFEAALALALAGTGLAPTGEAEAVAAACRRPIEDPTAILTSTWERGTPVIALVDAVRQRLETDEERRWVHFGATSQDVIDTAHMLQSKAAMKVLEVSLLRICRSLLELAGAHRSQPEMGRTFLQHARPMTFGRRVVGWLEPTLRHVQRLRAARDDLAVQLGGPVGSLASYGEAAPDVVGALAGHLSLQAPTLPWHSDRSRVWVMVETVEGPVRTCSKLAMDLSLLAQTDVGEVTMRGGQSSSMAGKANPIDPIRALASAEVCRGAAAMINQAKPHELDRALGSWHAEWYALPILFQTASAVFEAVENALESLEVSSEAMSSKVPEEPDEGAQAALDLQIAAVTNLFDEVVGRD